MNNKTLALFGASLLSLSAAVCARPIPQTVDVNAPMRPSIDQQRNYERDAPIKAYGPYVSAHVGYGYVNADTDKYDNDSNYDVSRTDFAWTISAGYQFNESASIEIGYMNMPNTRVKNKSTDFIDKHDIHATTVMFKGSMPLNPEQDLFGKIGLAAMRDSDKIYDASGNVVDSNKAYGSVNTVIFGLGMDFHTQPNLDLTAQVLFTPETDNRMPGTATALAGFTFRFA